MMASMFKYAAALIPWSGPGDRFVRGGYREALPPLERLERAASLGVLDGVELMYPAEVNEENIQELFQMLSDAGLALSIVGIPISGERRFAKGTLTSRDPAVRRTAIDRVKAGMDVCAALGGDQIMFFLGQDGCDYSLEVDYEEAWGWMAESIAEMATHRRDVKICLEYKPFEPRRHIFLNDVGTALHLADAIDADNVGVVLDTGHALMAGEVLGESIWLLHHARRLYHFHFNDNYRGWDDDMIVGSIHFMPFLEAIYWLKRIGYRGWISLDLFPYREDPDLAVTESIAFLKRLDEIIDEIGMKTITELLHQNDGARTLRVINRHVLGTK
jgi:sugar phosphate isomerase/epimerase